MLMKGLKYPDEFKLPKVTVYLEYNEEGYPYYYNESTGESEWAEYEEYSYEDSNGLTTEMDGDMRDYGESENESDDEEDEDDSDEESDEESDEDSQQQREQRVLDKKLEQKFKDYLKTPEGIAAAQAELERVGRKIDKRLAKKYSLVEQEYVRSLKSKKKEVPVPSNSIFGKIMESTNAWMFPPAEDKNSGSQDGSIGSARHSKKSATGKFDDYNRETKQRHGINSAAAAAEAGRAGQQQLQPTRGSPSSSRSSSLSSDTGSFSSDDSDIAQIDAPLFSEVPVAWYNLSNISNRLFGAWLQSTRAATNATDIDNASTTSSSTTSTVVTIPPAVNATLQYLQESTVVVAEQGFTMIGGAFVQGFGLLFERLNPMLESFVNGLLDAQMAGGPPRSRAAQRRLAAAAIANPTSERDLEQPEHPDYTALPPAPPPRAPSSASARAPSSARAPLSARGPPTHTPRGGVCPSPRTGSVTGPTNTLPTAPLPVSRSRQNTPRVSAIAESSPLSQLQQSIQSSAETASSPSHDEQKNRATEMQTTTAVETHSADNTLASEERDSLTPAAASNGAEGVQDEKVSESREAQLESVPAIMDAVQMGSEAAVATHEEVIADSKESRSDTPIEEIQEHLLSLALASGEEDEQQEQPDEGAAEVDATTSTADNNINMPPKDVDVYTLEHHALQLEEVMPDCEAEQSLGAVSEAVLPTVQIETTATNNDTALSAVIDTALTEEPK